METVQHATAAARRPPVVNAQFAQGARRGGRGPGGLGALHVATPAAAATPEKSNSFRRSNDRMTENARLALKVE